MPSRKEISGWMFELSRWFEGIADKSNFTCTNELNLRRAQMWKDRAAQVENMRCETCDRYVPGEDDEACTFNQIEYQGPGFGCFFHKPKEVSK